MADLLGEDFSVVQKDILYRCLDRLVAHKENFFSRLPDIPHPYFPEDPYIFAADRERITDSTATKRE